MTSKSGLAKMREQKARTRKSRSHRGIVPRERAAGMRCRRRHDSDAGGGDERENDDREKGPHVEDVPQRLARRKQNPSGPLRGARLKRRVTCRINGIHDWKKMRQVAGEKALSSVVCGVASVVNVVIFINKNQYSCFKFCISVLLKSVSCFAMERL